MPLVWRTVDPARLDPAFRAAVIDLFARLPDRYVVTHGARTLEEQSALYTAWMAYKRRGFTPPVAGKAAPPGRSAHNFGMAIDVVVDADPTTERLEPTWDTKVSGWVRLKLALAGHPLLSHGWWFGDWPHIEWRGWKALAGVR